MTLEKMYMNKYSRILGRRIKSQREKQLLSAEIVAIKLDVKTRDYLAWEGGIETPQERQLIKLSHILRSHVRELLSGIPLEYLNYD